MVDFVNEQYSPACRALLGGAPPVELGPGEPNEVCRDQLEQLDATNLFGGQAVVDHDMAACCRSGLWLLHNFLDESHRISQEVRTPSGSYWHGIMHRREPDFSNAKYWFRQVGEHAAFAGLHEAARQIAAASPDDPATAFLTRQQQWNPADFIDLCEAVIQGRSQARELCQAVAATEWQILFDHCYRAALGTLTK